jgi:hypothetical protein
MKKIVAGFLILIFGLFITYKYLYHNHRDISSEKSFYTITVKDLLKEFLANESSANKKYLDKAITIKGKITSIDAKNITIVIDEKVFVILSELSKIALNSDVSVQGRLIGYDSLLEEIKIDQAKIK